MIKIIKDIDICYDGIRSISLKEGNDFDVKSVLPNTEKAKVFKARLLGLNVAVEAGSEKPAQIEAAETAASEPAQEPENERPEPKRGRKKNGK